MYLLVYLTVDIDWIWSNYLNSGDWRFFLWSYFWVRSFCSVYILNHSFALYHFLIITEIRNEWIVLHWSFKSIIKIWLEHIFEVGLSIRLFFNHANIIFMFFWFTFIWTINTTILFINLSGVSLNFVVVNLKGMFVYLAVLLVVVGILVSAVTIIGRAI